MVTRKWDIWKVIRYEDGALKNGIGALKKETLEGSLTPSTMEGHSKKVAVYKPRGRLTKQ